MNKLYAYGLPNDISRIGQIKVGDTTRDDVHTRIIEQIGATRAHYVLLHQCFAIDENDVEFRDYKVHKALKARGIKNTDGEWFLCAIDDVKAAIIDVKFGRQFETLRTQSFAMRPEQVEAVEKAVYYNGLTTVFPKKFLFNCKMRFGKTFTLYQLMKKSKWGKTLVLTYKPSVRAEWRRDLESHVDFEGYTFIDRKSLKQRPVNNFVQFASLQDLLGKQSNGDVKEHNKIIYNTKWDCVVFDEYHFGAHQDLTLNEFDDCTVDVDEASGYDDVQDLISSDHFLYLSGTPFKMLENGHFLENQIYNWTYADEQGAKNSWVGDNNPYASLPKMNMYTYKMPSHVKEVANCGVYDEFDLNTFFKAKNGKFVHEDHVQRFLDLIRQKNEMSPVDFPFGTAKMQELLRHTFWYFNTVEACNAMQNLLGAPQNAFYHKYTVVNVAGDNSGGGSDALIPVEEGFTDNPLSSLTIILSCGRLNTGVTMAPLSGVLMLRNLQSPETYFQTTFRAQSPFVVDGVIEKHECFIFDFAPNRSLMLLSEYASKLSTDDVPRQDKIEETLKFLPVFAFDGTEMIEVNALEILEWTSSSISNSLLARKWQDPKLFSLKADLLEGFLQDERMMDILNSIEKFRKAKNIKINDNIRKIVNSNDEIKKVKKEVVQDDGQPDKKQKKAIDSEKEKMKSARQEVLDTLKTFIARIPLFMYVSEYREMSFLDIVRKEDDYIFEKTMAVTKADFKYLVRSGLIKERDLDDAVFKFYQFEENSLEYLNV